MIDLGFGDPAVVREEVNKRFMHKLHISDLNTRNLAYPPYGGEEKLIRLIKKFMVERLGLTEPKHVIITTGCTQSINVTLRGAYPEYLYVNLNKDRFYYYNHIIEKNRLDEAERPMKGVINIEESPSNGYGNMFKKTSVDIWDAVYFNKVYVNEELKNGYLKHDVFCSSLHKYFGMPGLRIGWIATDCDIKAGKILQELKYESCVISGLDQSLAVFLLQQDLDHFENIARYRINLNREEMSHLENLFNGEKVGKNGMFYTINGDESLKRLIEKAGVVCTELEIDGRIKLRFNLAQTNENVDKAVKNIIKEDRV